MNLISSALYGTDDLYVKGAYENLKLWPTIYGDGWKYRIYCSSPEPICRELQRLGADVWRFTGSGHMGMFARFLPAADSAFGYVVFRDLDSRANVREKAAVNAWMTSGKTFHVMRDKAPDHCEWPLLGGMWGCKGGAIPDITAIIGNWKQYDAKLDDMKMLATAVWPRVLNDMKHHSSVPTPHPGAEPFPPHGEYKGYVGEIIQPV